MEWKKTSCCLCFTNCGLEVLVQNNRIVKVRPDKDNPRSRGYACRKGMNIAYHQHNADRLDYPLKKKGDGFERISWEQAWHEIAERLGGILQSHGPRSLALMGVGGQGCQMGSAVALPFLHALGSRYHYSAAAQEWSGEFWVQGRCVGRQAIRFLPDHDHTDMLLAIGWNGMVSHSIPQTPRELKKLSRDPDKLLVVIDPRLSETARLADIHLPIRPGTDALLTKAMIAIILEEGWHDREYIDRHVAGFESIRPWFEGFDAAAAVKVCELDYGQVREVCRQFATRKSSLHADLGILMSRHSTLTSYLHVVLTAICGRICVPGGNILPGSVASGSHTDERDERTWRTMATNIPAVSGYFPPNVMPEEIMNDGPDRLRAVMVCAANPLRSYADTRAYEKAFGHLDLLVTVDMAMTETAALSHYVLPARSALESYDCSFFAWNHPEVFLQMRRPVVEPEGEQLEGAEIVLGLAEAMGLIPDIPDGLYRAAEKGCGPEFNQALFDIIAAEPKAGKVASLIVGKTLGRVLGSVNLASLYAMVQRRPKDFYENAVRAGFKPGPDLADRIFEAVMDHPEGLWVGRTDPEDNFSALATADGRVNVHIPEMADWMNSIDAATEAEELRADPDFPLVLMAGRHMNMNANTLMRDPDWNKGRRACTLAMNPVDAEKYGLADGRMVSVVTAAGRETIELEVTPSARPGQVVIPHGFGLNHRGEVYGININNLTQGTHRDRMFATPLHRYVPCRVEAVVKAG